MHAVDAAGADQWPVLGDGALHGLAGDFVRAIGPHTEASWAALLVQHIATFGALVGRGAWVIADGSKHYPNLFVGIVGDSAKSRKGTSWGRVRGFMAKVYTDLDLHIASGLTSGEGLTWRVRDPIHGTKIDRRTGAVETVCLDEGVADKRLLVVESELSQPLSVIRREGNTLSATMRLAWDGLNLCTLAKNSPAIATAPHIAVIGHIVAEELHRQLTSTDAANGFGNRFAWICAKRSQLLPHGGLDPELHHLEERTAAALAMAREAGEVRFDPGARALWERLYNDMAQSQSGLLGSMTARGEAQTLRFSLLYALLDGKREIGIEHLEAGASLWDYAQKSAVVLFGNSTGDPVGSRILAALRSKTTYGMTRTDMHRMFRGNRAAQEINTALLRLEGDGLAESREERSTGGAPATRWFAVLSSSAGTN